MSVLCFIICYLSSHLQCIIVFTLQLKKPYFVSNPIIQNGHDLSCCRQHRSAFEKPPISVYFFADHPLPHHFVPGTLSRFDKSLRRLQLSFFALYKVCYILLFFVFFFAKEHTTEIYI